MRKELTSFRARVRTASAAAWALVLMGVLLAGCNINLNVSEFKLWIEPDTVQSGERLWIRYEDGTVSTLNYAATEQVNDWGVERTYELYRAEAEPGKAVVGIFASDGDVSWIPSIHFTKRGDYNSLAVNRADWGKPTAAASHVQLLRFAPDVTAPGVYSLVLQVNSLSGNPAEGRTELFAASEHPAIRLIHPLLQGLTARVQGVSAPVYGGIAELKVSSLDGHASLTENDVMAALSFASGAKVLSTAEQQVLHLTAGTFAAEQQQPSVLLLTAQQLMTQLSVTERVYADSLTVANAVVLDSRVAYAGAVEGSLLLHALEPGQTTVTAVVYDHQASKGHELSISVSAAVQSSPQIPPSHEELTLYAHAGSFSVKELQHWNKKFVPVRYSAADHVLTATADTDLLEQQLRQIERGQHTVVLTLPSDEAPAAKVTLYPDQLNMVRDYMSARAGLAHVIVAYNETYAIVPASFLGNVPAGASVEVTIVPGAGVSADKSEWFLLSFYSMVLDYFGWDELKMKQNGEVVVKLIADIQ